ncbi:MAG: hypothetical protein V1821_01770 [bacterium]
MMKKMMTVVVAMVASLVPVQAQAQSRRAAVVSKAIEGAKCLLINWEAPGCAKKEPTPPPPASEPSTPPPEAAPAGFTAEQVDAAVKKALREYSAAHPQTSATPQLPAGMVGWVPQQPDLLNGERQQSHKVWAMWDTEWFQAFYGDKHPQDAVATTIASANNACMGLADIDGVPVIPMENWTMSTGYAAPVDEMGRIPLRNQDLSPMLAGQILTNIPVGIQMNLAGTSGLELQTRVLECNQKFCGPWKVTIRPPWTLGAGDVHAVPQKVALDDGRLVWMLRPIWVLAPGPSPRKIKINITSGEEQRLNLTCLRRGGSVEGWVNMRNSSGEKVVLSTRLDFKKRAKFVSR